MTDSEEARAVVAQFLNSKKDVMLDRMERVLREIAKLRWWEGGKAREMAKGVLEIGKSRTL